MLTGMTRTLTGSVLSTLMVAGMLPAAMAQTAPDAANSFRINETIPGYQYIRAERMREQRALALPAVEEETNKSKSPFSRLFKTDKPGKPASSATVKPVEPQTMGANPQAAPAAEPAKTESVPSEPVQPEPAHPEMKTEQKPQGKPEAQPAPKAETEMKQPAEPRKRNEPAVAAPAVAPETDAKPEKQPENAQPETPAPAAGNQSTEVTPADVTAEPIQAMPLNWDDTKTGTKDNAANIQPVAETPATKPEDTRKALEHYNNANKLGKKGNLKEAMAEYNSALDLNPAFPDARVGLATIYGKMGQWKEAVTQLEKTMGQEKAFVAPFNFVQAQYNLSAAYCMNGNAEKAASYLNAVEKAQHPQSAKLKNFLNDHCTVAN
ncbi:MAG: tetratricopeptide repeat protein [Candidatus Melainabacteria bacterium]